MLTVSALHIYPIKSLGGISLPSVRLGDRGPQYDRRWMLADEQGRFITQREWPQLALLQTSLTGNHLMVSHKHEPGNLVHIPLDASSASSVRVQVWDDEVEALEMEESISQWFSQYLGFRCRLVYMPDTSHRLVDPDYARSDELTGFSDGFPVLIIGEASLNDLNERLDFPVPMNRFRPNIVFSGGDAFEEDTMAAFEINGIPMSAAKPCARCVMTTHNQETGEAGKEPLRTLSTYRSANNKVYFGQNVLYQSEGIIHVGDRIMIINRKPGLTFK